MDRKSRLRQIAFAAFVALGAAQGVNAQALQASGANAGVVSQPGTTTALPSTSISQAGQTDTSALTPDESKQSAAGNVAELQQMIRGSDLSELRTTYNGSYVLRRVVPAEKLLARDQDRRRNARGTDL
jgi:hypothetical protein